MVNYLLMHLVVEIQLKHLCLIRLFPHNHIKFALIDTISIKEANNANYTDDYLELCAEIEKTLPIHEFYAPPIYI